MNMKYMAGVALVALGLIIGALFNRSPYIVKVSGPMDKRINDMEWRILTLERAVLDDL